MAEKKAKKMIFYSNLHNPRKHRKKRKKLMSSSLREDTKKV